MTERLGIRAGGCRFWIMDQTGDMCGGHPVALSGRINFAARLNLHRSHFKRIEDAQRQGDFFVGAA